MGSIFSWLCSGKGSGSVRRSNIAHGRVHAGRPLRIAAIEDKVVQAAAAVAILTPTRRTLSFCKRTPSRQRAKVLPARQPRQLHCWVVSGGSSVVALAVAGAPWFARRTSCDNSAPIVFDVHFEDRRVVDKPIHSRSTLS